MITQRASACYYGHRCCIRVMADKSVRYRYDLHMHCPGDEAEFPTFAEVGEPYKVSFREIVEKHRLLISKGTKEFDQYPWLADELISTGTHAEPGWVTP